MHGYQIGSELERMVAGGRYNSAQIYQGLRWLEDRGFVVAEPVQEALRDRRPFTATAQGRREFQRWLGEPLVPARPFRDDVVIKLVFLGLDNPGQLIRALERLRRQHLLRLTGTEFGASSQSAHDGHALVAELSGAALRFREQAELRWIEYCLLRLRSVEGAGSDMQSDAEGSVEGRTRSGGG